MAYTTQDRAESLREFQAELETIDFRNDAEFQMVLRKAQELLEMSDQAIADALLVSRPTVNRWVNGKNLPYNAIRKPVISWIAKQLMERIRAIGGSGRSYTASSSSLAAAPSFDRMVAKSRE